MLYKIRSNILNSFGWATLISRVIVVIGIGLIIVDIVSYVFMFGILLSKDRCNKLIDSVDKIVDHISSVLNNLDCKIISFLGSITIHIINSNKNLDNVIDFLKENNIYYESNSKDYNGGPRKPPITSLIIFDKNIIPMLLLRFPGIVKVNLD